MRRCFVMQPFDRGTFDKRYDDVYAPAIQDADLEPYRVDRDPSVRIPIEDIESGIRNSEICLADITTDNPNVWFELGFAIAVPREVVLVCSDERTTHFPFDVQHRNILRYKTESKSDFDKLRSEIAERIQGLLEKERTIGSISNLPQVADTEGLSQNELVALATVMKNRRLPEADVSEYDRIKNSLILVDGFNDLGVSIALQGILDKGMITTAIETSRYLGDRVVYSMTEKGVQWLMRNKDKLVLKSDGS
uniref:CD-NTase-associated protein 12/Pycsar effector protein TIR domain-containing protein n=1 Tax=Candidatus Methanogaster sp. ANME-2c ERB4 TaxID=2759911 RepID=A0A7G9YQW0_9EURY|nr:hypothetical protein CKJHOKLD_00015 [Methanosarcinales archaeon ANME-2c ERB4]